MADAPSADELARVRGSARCLADAVTIERAVDRMAQSITEKLSQADPLLLTVMNGGLVPAAMLLRRLDFPLQVDYTHLTRYGLRTTGGELRWVKRPPESVRGRTVLVVDDLLDHGITLDAIVEACHDLGAAEVLTAVLITKQVEQRAGLRSTDFSALSLPDEYLFGYGMDYKTYLRNAPGIFAVDGDHA
ncbi:MAG: hypoxanthine-guanine phosphoribosyltransferase [Gammaproteobacteria bacterium]|nr:hypoxanthine-guanine phosphoribosyltransferase [Gammaproteobacteria bacterium]MCP5201589.1 hypoxanthine-guanine phosphoribosyltransferase [Gammaproteobacteria bacterium]